jgi:hypothetical protein
MILQYQEIGHGVTRQPAGKEGAQSINGELWIVAWDRHEDAVTPEQASLFYDDRSHLNRPAIRVRRALEYEGQRGSLLDRRRRDP